MNVTQFLQRLSYGPLSNLSMSNEGDGTIIAAKLPAVVGYLNDALLRLYTRFDLLEKEVVVEMVEGVTRYKIDSKYAVTTTAENPTLPHYIKDSVGDPYTDDLIKMLSVWMAGDPRPVRLGLNDDHNPQGLFTPKHDTLQVPNPEAGVALYVIYQARHPILTVDELDAVIDIPAVLEPALVSFVARLIYFHMNGQEHGVKASEHFAAYENLCGEVTETDMAGSTLSFSNTKLETRGFC